MLRAISEQEKRMDEMRVQLVYIYLQLSYDDLNIDYGEKENEIWNAPDEEILRLYKIYEKKILSEEWVDVYPGYYHIDIFEDVLDDQVISCESYPDCKISIGMFYQRIGKTERDVLTIDEKIDLYWLTHPIKY